MAKQFAAALSLLVIAALPMAAAAQDDAQPVEERAQEPRDAEVIAAEIKDFKFPQFDQSRNGQEEYVQEFLKEHRAAMAKWQELVSELFQADPGHADLPRHMERRWMELLHQGEADKIREEARRAIEYDAQSDIAKTARFYIAQISIREHREDPAKAIGAVDEFIQQVPEDERGARLLMQVAGMFPTGSEEQVAAFQRIIDEFEGTRTANWAGGQLRQVTSIGQPFELAFTCATTGREIDMKSLHGKVVLIDFWATWCGPCIAEMPHLKELYAKYHDEGFEIIGVSLDSSEADGGLDALRQFVEEKEIPWPQYYQGNGWEGEFSTSWGINAIPALFLVDRAGRLRSTAARGKLDELIPELLAEDASTPFDATQDANAAPAPQLVPLRIGDSK